MMQPAPTRIRTLSLASGLPLLLAGVMSALPAEGSAQERRRTSNQAPQITASQRAAVKRGLIWLADQQNSEGGWTQDIGFKLNTGYEVQVPKRSHPGVSALALMSFLAGGHLPGRGRHGDVLDRGIDYVLTCVRENGFIVDNETRMYSHAFATLFLAEVYGMTNRSDVGVALQRAVDLIVDSQNAEGGWRYKPFARESDMSITVCQVIALRSARNVGIHVPASTVRAAQEYVYLSAVEERGSRSGYYRGQFLNDGGPFRYQLRQRSRATFPLTAAGVTTLFAAGEYDSRLTQQGMEYLESQLDGFNDWYAGHYFFYYGHYYAVQAFYIHGGQPWKRYWNRMQPKLLELQQPNGSWPCQTGPGEAFATAVATLILQIPYQYLPIFQR